VDERHFASKQRCAGGPLLSALIVIIMAVVAEYQHLLRILLFIVGYRFFQDYLLGPRLMGAEVGVQPILVPSGLLAGAEVAGVTGIFLSVPAIAAFASRLKPK
jgi:predicted PurR-regulated permease PerM